MLKTVTIMKCYYNLTVFYVNTVYCKKAEFSAFSYIAIQKVFLIIKNNKKIKNYIFIQQGCIKLIKSDNKDIYNVTKDFYLK